MDNQDPVVDNLDPNAPPATPTPNPTPAPTPTPTPAPIFTWKDNLGADLKNSPTLQKFTDDKDGLVKAVESYTNLEKLLGHEKVPIPKGPEDKEGWARFRSAMGIPSKPEGYGLKDASIPDSLKGLTFDKATFAQVMHKADATPAQAAQLWDAYTQMASAAYQKAVEDTQKQVTGAINTLRQKWGDAYDANVDLGQTVINKFSDNKEMADFLTATLVKDARGIEFLAKIGSQFAENKIGDFSLKRHSLTPDEAQKEIDAIRADAKHPYNDLKAPADVHERAVQYVNSLYAIVNRTKQGQA